MNTHCLSNLTANIINQTNLNVCWLKILLATLTPFIYVFSVFVDCITEQSFELKEIYRQNLWLIILIFVLTVYTSASCAICITLIGIGLEIMNHEAKTLLDKVTVSLHDLKQIKEMWLCVKTSQELGSFLIFASVQVQKSDSEISISICLE